MVTSGVWSTIWLGVGDGLVAVGVPRMLSGVAVDDGVLVGIPGPSTDGPGSGAEEMYTLTNLSASIFACTKLPITLSLPVTSICRSDSSKCTSKLTSVPSLYLPSESGNCSIERIPKGT